jgi:photosystem II S4 domain protein
MLPREALLEGSQHPGALAALISQAETALRTWEPQWSPFVGAAVLEEANLRLGALSELQLSSWGGHPHAERRRLQLGRAELEPAATATADLAGVELLGNFLFDPATPDDFRTALLASGVEAGDLGDLWVRGDRGAQAIVTAAAAAALNGCSIQVRSVPTQASGRTLDSLQLPTPRLPRRLSTVEASLRLDAVGSAGFGLSRSRMAELIRQGAVRLNWQPVTSPSRELACGDRVQVQGRGELQVETAELTRKNRWRVELLRQ